MAPRVGLVVDSTCDLPENWPYRSRIHVIPMHIRFGDTDYREGVDITESEFYQKILTQGLVPKTSQPSPGEFADFYRQLAPQYDVILSLHLGSKLSGTYQSAVLGAQMVADQIQVIPFDSNGGSAGVGFMADETFEMLDAGATLDEVLQRLALLRERIQIILTPKDLHFARMSGRINALSAFVASMLRIHPIIMLEDGKLEASQRARSRKKALGRMVQLLQQRLGPGPSHIAIVHAQAPEAVESLKKEVVTHLQPQKLWIAKLSSAVSSHLGPGTIGLGGYRID